MVKINRNMCYLFFVNIRNKLGYFGDMTNLHGIPNVFSMSRIPFLKRLFWSGIVMSCCFGAGFVLHSALEAFSTGLASYAVETNYLDWDTPFPAVTICDDTNSDDHVKKYLREHKKPSTLAQFYKDVSYWNVIYCRVCKAGCESTSQCEQDFDHGIKEIRYKCPELLTDCWWGGKHYKCCDIFHPFETEYGECYVFNSALLGNTSVLTVNRKVGVPDLLFTAVQKIAVIVHTPDDIPSVLFENVLSGTSSLSLVTEFEAILKIEQTVNDASVASLPVSMRGCLFKKERPSLASWPFQRYTYSGCLLHCRRLAQSAACNCTHHFLSTIFATPACDIKGLHCLNENKDPIKNYQCDCPTACDDTQYKVVHTFFKRVHKSPEKKKRGTLARIRLANLPTLRVRRLAIKDTLGLVVDIGGVGGVFFGASLLSAIELVYLLCIRRN